MAAQNHPAATQALSLTQHFELPAEPPTRLLRHGKRGLKAILDYVTSRSRLIPVGEPAPDFTCALSDGTQLTLSSLRGLERVVLVFYPGDNTPLCTSQLCGFRDGWEHFQERDTRVYGVNPAAQAKHAQFVAQHGFPFPLLVDAGGQVADMYGCRMLFGIVRRTVYAIDRQGRVAFAERGNPAPASVLRALEDLKD